MIGCLISFKILGNTNVIGFVISFFFGLSRTLDYTETRSEKEKNKANESILCCFGGGKWK